MSGANGLRNAPGWYMFVTSSQVSFSPSHDVRLFDRVGSLAQHLSAFVSEGLRANATVLVVATNDHWLATLERLTRAGAPVAEAIASGQLTILDAPLLLRRFASHGVVEPAAFEDHVGTLVRQLHARGEPLWVYGEMVNLLVGEGAFSEAERLEHLWNELLREVPARLLCGYAAVHFGHARSGESLRRICHAHDHVEAGLEDSLSLWLLTQNGPAHQEEAAPEPDRRH